MTGRERAEASLRREIPDRVPIFELLVDDAIIEALCPGGGGYVQFADEYDLDIVLTGTPSSNYRMEELDRENRVFRDEWGVIRKFSDQTVPFPMEAPLKTETDIQSFNPPDPRDPYRFNGLIKLLENFKGEKLVGMHVHDAFSYPSYLRGMDVLFMDMVERPEIVHELVRISVEHTKVLIQKAHRLGAELFVFGDDYAGNLGPMMSPKHFEEFFLPGLSEVVRTAKEMGAFTVKHTDGNIHRIADMLVDSGVDALHPLDPEAGMDIAAFKKKYGDRVCVIGNIDTGKVLSEDSTDAVTEIVLATIEKTAPGGGYIISSANSIHPHVKPENYAAMLKAARRFGDYAHLGKD